MNTKTFAQQARRLLIDGVAKKLLYWGFDTKGNILETPQKVSGGYVFRDKTFDDPNALHLLESLKQAVQHKTIEVVVEEAAYTWFNRIMALRIMAKNCYEPALLVNAEGLEHTPVLLQKARQGQYSFLNKLEQDRLKKIIGDYSKDQEAFSILLVGYCHSNTMLNNVFGKIDDYTELLLPDNMLQDSGFLHLLNTTDAISDEEYKEVELIGWLYQFYISERKDEVFASFTKGKKAEAKDIPAATQIFTPNWIVKYMVQNTAGKIWLDKKPNSPLRASMEYLVENDSLNTNESIINNVEELTLIDPAAGSGHILVEGFDLLYQMYIEEYYTPEEAVESILKNNLFGLDIDDRAAQLATFAILLKAAKYYRDIFSKGWLPNVYAMPEEKIFSMQEVKDYLGAEGIAYTEELDAALRLMKQAKNLGSVMKLSVSEEAQAFIAKRFNELKNAEYQDINLQGIFQSIKNYIPVLLLLTKKYTAVVANPPYMHRSNMNDNLRDYVFTFYPKSKTDLFAVFIEANNNFCSKNGYVSSINQQSWMFISSYDELRLELINNFSVVNLVHLGLHVFKELNSKVVQSVAYVLKKENANEAKGVFIDVRKAFGIDEKEKQFFERKSVFLQNQNSFLKIPGATIAYWVSESGYKIFENKNISDFSTIFQGMITGDNNKFVRSWYEVDLNKIYFDIEGYKKGIIKDKYWVGYSKGGESVKWYGNQDHIVNFSKEGKDFTRGKAQFNEFYFKEYITWSYISLSLVSRYFPKGFIWDVAGSGLFLNDDKKLNFITALLSSKVGNYILGILNPTLNYQVENIAAVPIIIPEEETFQKINFKSIECINYTKEVYDGYETSFNFEKLKFIGNNETLRLDILQKVEYIFNTFSIIYNNEVDLNSILINLYGLDKDLTPDINLNEITTFSDELKKAHLTNVKSIKNIDNLPVSKEELIYQFISYAIGLFMGRYRLDKPGLNIAHPNPTVEELTGYSYNNGKVVIDEDAILPLMGKNCNFPDDALQQINQLLDTIWGHETRIENSNFIQECLGKELEKFLVKDFYKYHCKMYKNKPIYWLFTSKTGAFQVIVYMHRMNAFTVEKIRANYMLEHLKNLRSEESMLQANSATLNTQDAKRLDQIRKDLVECEAYDMELKNVADQQITFDLDDGVTANYAKFESVLAKIR